MAKKNETGKKKPIYKKWWFWVLVVILIYAISPKSTDTADDTEQQDESVDVVDTIKDEEPLSFELVAGEAGEYGELFTMNKDTEFEETYYIYYVPSGTYTITNSGDYMGQFNVCSKETHVTEDGWEEPAEIFYVKALDVDESDTVTIENDQYIEIHEPAKFTLESK